MLLVSLPRSERVPPLIFRLTTGGRRLRSAALLSALARGSATKVNSSGRIARYEAHGHVHYGVVDGDNVTALSASPFEEHTLTDHVHKLSDVKLLAPVVPGKILAMGLNYTLLQPRRRPARPGIPDGFPQDPHQRHRPGGRHRPPQRGAAARRRGRDGGGNQRHLQERLQGRTVAGPPRYPGRVHRCRHLGQATPRVRLPAPVPEAG